MPVAWQEYFLVLALTTCLAIVMSRHVDPWLVARWRAAAKAVRATVCGRRSAEAADAGRPTLETILDEIEALTGAEAEPDWTLAECGLASVAAPVVRSQLLKAFPQVSIALDDLVRVDTVAGLAKLVDERRAAQETAKGV